MALDPTAAHLALAEWMDAPAGGRTATMKRLAASLGCSVASLYREFNAMGHSGPKRASKVKYPERREHAAVLAVLTNKAPVGTIALDQCLDAAIRDGKLPPEAGGVRVSEYARLIREAGFREGTQRTRKLVAEYPMQAVQFDATTSRSFRVLRQLDDGDELLELWWRPDPASGYKNKPLGEDRKRLILYGQWDMCTGAIDIRTRAALGESGLDAMECLVESWVGGADPRLPWQGKPEDLWCDQGPLVKYPATRDLLERLDVQVCVGKPYQHTRQGGIEGVWRSVWSRFENAFYLGRTYKEKWTIRLSEYDAALREYLVEANARPSRCEPHLSRRDAWVNLSNRHGGVRPCPPDALETLAIEAHRTLNSNGVFTWGRDDEGRIREYEVPKYHSRKVIARRALDGSDRCIVEIPETGERVIAARAVYLGYGEFKGQPPALPVEKARAAGADLVCPTPVYGPTVPVGAGLPAQDPKVVHLPPRAKPIDHLEDPLSVPADYPTLADALVALRQIYAHDLDPMQQDLVERILVANGLSRNAVRNLGLGLAARAAQPAQADTPTRPHLKSV